MRCPLFLFQPVAFGDPWESRTPASAVKGRRLSRLTKGPDYLFFVQIARIFHRIIPSDNLSQFIRLNLSIKIIKHILYLSSFILHIYYNIFFVKNQERFFMWNDASNHFSVSTMPSHNRDHALKPTARLSSSPLPVSHLLSSRP